MLREWQAEVAGKGSGGGAFYVPTSRFTFVQPRVEEWIRATHRRYFVTLNHAHLRRSNHLAAVLGQDVFETCRIAVHVLLGSVLTLHILSYCGLKFVTAKGRGNGEGSRVKDRKAIQICALSSFISHRKSLKRCLPSSKGNNI